MQKRIPKPILTFDLSKVEHRRLLLERTYGRKWRIILADCVECDPSLISHVVAGRRRNVEIQQLIAKAIGFKARDIWPDAA